MAIVKFSRKTNTAARGRNGWFIPDTANVSKFYEQDLFWIDISSHRPGNPSIQMHLTREDMIKLRDEITAVLN